MTGRTSAGRIGLALVLHNHQPVGNFDSVVASVYDTAYAPMLDALERHPAIRLALHYSGPLLEWLLAHRPAAVARIRALGDRGQVEIVGGAWYEAILAALPQRDRHAQLVRMADELERLFGQRPRGAWLAERVWEPSVPFDLARAGYAWTILDDTHLRAASVPEDGMWSAFTTDDQGERLSLFGTEAYLRGAIPFGEVEGLIAYLRGRAEPGVPRVGVMGDDGEKFGAWPTTFEHCWGRGGWVERCFEALEANADWLETLTPSAWLERERPAARIFPPTTSYVEMTEWALPPDEQPAFHEALEAAAKAGAPAARYLRGGTWRNFQARYREIDDLHKQMLRTSAKVDAMPPGPPRERALEHLHRGQSNDCYWHGLFGGIYIVHMRLATLAELIAAEDLADEGFADGRDQPAAWTIGDVDLDGRPDALGTTAGQTVVVDLAAGAGIGAWDLRASRLAALSVMRRRPEAYHARLRQVIETGQTAPRPPREPAVISIHDAEAPPDPSLAGLLRYDRHERRGGLVRILSVGTALDELRAATERELGDFVVGAFRLEGKASRESVLQAVRIGSVEGSGGLEVRKRFTLDGGRLDPSLRLEVTASNIGGRRIEADLALEWGFNLAGGGGNPAAWYQLASGERLPHDGTGEIHETDRVAFGNEDLGVRIAVRLEPAGRVGWYPIETVSNSEAGPEKAYQGSCLLARWPLRLAPGDALAVRFGLRAEQTIDRRAEERGEDRDAGESPA